MQNLKQKEDLDGIKRPRCPKFLFVVVQAFMKVVKKGNAFLIYTFPSPYVEPRAHEILSQYHEFKDVFEKKNANTLPKQWPYDYTIDLHEERLQPPFGPIYNFSQNKLVTLCEYIDKNFEKGFIQHCKSLVGASILFAKKRMDPSECVSIIVGWINSP